MTEPADEGGAPAELARKYLDLWLEHWAASMAAPETAAALARILGAANTGGGLAGFDQFVRRPGAGDEPAAFRTAPNAGDSRVDELEKRVAALERRLAELGPGAKADLAGPARKPRRRTRPA